MRLPTGPELGALAIEEYRLRYARAVDKRAKRALSSDEANALLQPWASLALRLASDPAALIERGDLSPLAEHWHVMLMPTVTGQDGMPTSLAATLLAEDLCPRAEMVATVAAARDAALLREQEPVTDPARSQAILRLVTIAIAIGCSPADPRIFANRQDERIAA